MRSREDVGGGGVAAFGAVLALVMVSTMARAEPVAELRVQEQPSLDVVVTVKAAHAPTFQIFRLPGQDAFAVELPGADLKGAARELGGEGVLLEGASVESDGGAPRVIVRFFGDVDYDAKSEGGQLKVTFSALGDRGALKQAWQKRKGDVAARTTAQKDLERSQQKLEEQRRAYLAQQRDFEDQQAKAKAALVELDEKTRQARAGLMNLEQRRADEERRIQELGAKQQDAAAALAKLDERRQQTLADMKRVQQDLVRAQEELAKARDQRALEEAKNQIALVKRELASVQEKKAAEERRVVELKGEIEGARAALDGVLAKQRAEQQELASLEKRRQQESARTAQASDEMKRAEQLMASVVERQAFEARRLQDLEAQVKRAAQQLTGTEQRLASAEQRLAGAERKTVAEANKLAALESAVADQQRALASLEQRRQHAEARLAAADAQLRQPRTEPPTRVAQVEKKPAAQQRVEPAREEPRISMAQPASSPTYGFGGKSIDITTRGRNRYENNDVVDLDERDGDEQDARGTLSHVTVQRGQGTASRVGVRVDGGARYALSRRGEREVVLTLYDTRAANLDVRRILDARDLGTNVLRVLPRVHEGDDDRVELTIELREAVPIRIGQDESMLWLHVGT